MDFKLRFGGMPTDAEVHQLLDRFGSPPKEGTSIPYEEISLLLGFDDSKNRWKTVTDQWRKRLQREHNCIFKATGRQFTVLVPGQRIDLAVGKTRHAFKTFRRVNKIVTMTDRERLTSEDQQRADHLMKTLGTISLSSAADAKKQLPEPPGPVGK